MNSYLNIEDPKAQANIRNTLQQLSEKYAQKPLALVVGGSVNALGVVRSLGPKGIGVVLLTSQKLSVAARSRFIGACIICKDAYEDGLIEALVNLGPLFFLKPVLFLTHDFQVKRVSASSDLLRKFYQFILPDFKLVQSLISKKDFLEVACRCGLDVPKTLVVMDQEELLRVKDQLIGFKWVAKPLEKNEVFEGLFGKASLLDTEESILDFVQKAKKIDIPVMLQEWVSGSDTDVLFCLAYQPASQAKGVFFTGRKIRQFRPRIGNTASAEKFDDEMVSELTSKLFEKVGFTGLGSMEFKYDSNSGRYLSIEPTIGRTDLQSELSTINGCNILWKYYADVTEINGAEGLRTLEVKPPRKDKLWIRLWPDILSCLHYCRCGELTLLGWMRSYCRPMKFSVWRMSDPMPFLFSAFIVAESRVKSILKRLIGERRIDLIKSWLRRRRAT